MSMKRSILAVRIFLVLALAAATGFIFSQSLKDGGDSASLSLTVTNALLRFFGVDSDSLSAALFDRVHFFVRKLAHFSEYALLGALWFWCVRSFTAKKTTFILPPATAFLTACIDETLQIFSPGRGNSFFDVLLDFSGAVCGVLFAWLVVFIAIRILKTHAAKNSPTGTGYCLRTKIIGDSSIKRKNRTVLYGKRRFRIRTHRI